MVNTSNAVISTICILTVALGYTGWSIETLTYNHSLRNIYISLSGACFYMQISPEVWTFWYLTFKVTKKSFFVKIKVSGKNKLNLQILVKIQRKISLIHQTDFVFALMFRHFIVESSYFTKWRGMHQREKLYFFLMQFYPLAHSPSFCKMCGLND